MSDVQGHATQYGFKFGAAEVTRAATHSDGCVVIQVRTDTGGLIDVYVSRTGRSLRVFSDGKEWKPA